VVGKDRVYPIHPIGAANHGPQATARSVEDLTVLLLAFDKLTPGHVTEDLISFLQQLPTSPVACDLLLSALKLVKEQEPKGARR
jgi:hypothetical protein